MTRIRIPKTAEGVTDELGQIGELLTATEWRRAALLAAIVRLPGSGGDRRSARRDQTPVAGFETAEQFAARGIKGLRKGDTVRLYVQRWLDANDGEYPELGAAVVLPEDEWPPTRTGTDGINSDTGMRSKIREMVDKHGPEALASAISEEFSDEGVEAVVEAATRRRPGPAQAGTSRGIAARVPAAPFDTPPDIYPGQGGDTARMELERLMERLDNATTGIEVATREDRSKLRPHRERLFRHREIIQMLIESTIEFDEEGARRLLDGADG